MYVYACAHEKVSYFLLEYIKQSGLSANYEFILLFIMTEESQVRGKLNMLRALILIV
jgi:hypothetical protein